MRLWTIHPKYLDPQGLVALWREALLARAVLCGQTVGYLHHPQLMRFRAHSAPRTAINAYLVAVLEESQARGYSFDSRKVGPVRGRVEIAATSGQIAHEWRHLLGKLKMRSPRLFAQVSTVTKPQAHPLFRATAGAVAPWERI